MKAKWYKFVETLKEPVEANNGDFGYFVTIGDLLDNGGRNEFFRKVSRGGKVLRNVYYGLEYDRGEKAYYADCYTNSCIHSGALKRSDVVFIGFDF